MRTLIGKAARRGLEHFGRGMPPIVRYDDTADYDRLYSADEVAERRFYNVGSGSFFHPRWTNLDFVSDRYAKVQKNVVPYDLMADGPLPIPDGTAALIYTSHTVEHVKDHAVDRLCSNAFRALRKGGIFRITTGPDADTDFRAMMAGDADWFYWDDVWSRDLTAYRDMFHGPPNARPLEERWLSHFAGELTPNNRVDCRKFAAPEIREIIEREGYPGCLDYFTQFTQFRKDFTGNHVSWWNSDKLIATLRKAGFENVYRSGYGQSAAHVLRNTHYFDNTHPQMSVYVEAVR